MIASRVFKLKCLRTQYIYIFSHRWLLTSYNFELLYNLEDKFRIGRVVMKKSLYKSYIPRYTHTTQYTADKYFKEKNNLSYQIFVYCMAIQVPANLYRPFICFLVAYHLFGLQLFTADWHHYSTRSVYRRAIRRLLATWLRRQVDVRNAANRISVYRTSINIIDNRKQKVETDINWLDIKELLWQ